MRSKNNKKFITPHEVTLLVPDDMSLLIVFDRITGYLPKMSNVVWAIDSGRKILGYILTDNQGMSRYETCEQNSNMVIWESRCCIAVTSHR